MRIKENEAIISNTLKINNKLIDILSYNGRTLLISLNLQVIKQWNDTIPVYSLFDPTTIIRLYIIKVYECDIKNLQLNNYDKVQQCAYHRRLISKLLDFTNH